MSKVAIVTGASGNLGQAIVKKFIAEGHQVIGTVVSPGYPILPRSEANFEQVSVNLADEFGSSEFVESVIKKYGRIDTAVLTVGGFARGSVAETTASDVMKQYKLNFETTYHVAQPVFRQMLHQKSGRIFFTGARPGLDAGFGMGMVAYGLAKSLLFRLADLMNDESKGLDIVTCVIVPSTIDTPQNRLYMPDSDPALWVTPESIADVINFYCTGTAAAVRGPIIKLYNNS